MMEAAASCHALLDPRDYEDAPQPMSGSVRTLTQSAAEVFVEKTTLTQLKGLVLSGKIPFSLIEDLMAVALTADRSPRVVELFLGSWKCGALNLAKIVSFHERGSTHTESVQYFSSNYTRLILN